MIVDVNAKVAALDHPMVRVGAITYRGRILSIEQWEPFENRLREVYERPEDAALWQALAKDLFRAVFPKEHLRWWHPDPVPKLVALPWTVQVEIVASFVEAQRRANGIRTVPRNAPPPTPGPSSSD